LFCTFAAGSLGWRRKQEHLLPMSLRDLQKMPGHLIRRLQQIAVALFVAECEALDLTPVQYASLTVIRDAPDLDVTRLSSLVALDKATLAKVIERLEAKGWILRSGSGLDKRVKLLKITPKGRKVLASAEPAVRRCQRRILAPLAEEDRQNFMRMLEQLVEINNDYSRAPMRAPRGAGSQAVARRRRKSSDPADA
jgi:MarR family transcriptional regulator, lower aerobic nicotinate degradation pathway regulator